MDKGAEEEDPVEVNTIHPMSHPTMANLLRTRQAP